MSRRPTAAILVLLLLVGGITALFLTAPRPEPEPPTAPRNPPAQAQPPVARGPLAGLAPRLRGLRTGGSGREEAEVVAQSLVDGALGGTPERARPVVLAALASADWTQQWAGALGVRHYGPPDAALASALSVALASDDVWVRRAVAATSGYVRTDGFELLAPALERAARDPDAAVRAAALNALGRRLPRELHRLPLFRDALADPESSVREAGARGLAQVELQERLPADDVAALITPLLRVLDDEVAEVRMYACMALGRAGPAAAPAIPKLLDLLTDKYVLVKSQAASALGYMGTVALPALERALRADEGRLASSLLWSLRLMGDAALPVVDRALEHPVGVVRMQAAMKRWEMKREFDVVLPVLVDGLGSADVETLLLAIRALGRIGPPARSTVAAIQALGEHEEEIVRRAVRGAVLLIAPDEAKK